MASPENTDTLILCGGKGTRLRAAVPDRPKALAEVSGKPFLDILLAELQEKGLRRFVLCTGFGAEQIIARYERRMDAAAFVFSVEARPLGTAGALALALPLVRSDPVVVANGDSFCSVDIRELLRAHCDRRAALTMAVVPAEGRSDVGTVRVDASNRIVAFSEKSGVTCQGENYVNAGVYVMSISVLRGIPSGVPCSLEMDVFPGLATTHPCFVFPVEGPLVDIGTPERLQGASRLLR